MPWFVKLGGALVFWVWWSSSWDSTVELVTGELPHSLPPMGGIQPVIDLILGVATLHDGL